MPMLWEGSPFSSEWHALAGDLEDEFFAKQPSPPEVLFHYTSLAGLKGIVESQTIWATHAAFLNDLSELAYAQGLFDQIAEKLQKTTTSTVGGLLLERARRAIDPFDGLVTFFVSCFCKDEDLLSQWRGYAAQGGGYALGFSLDGLVNGQKSQPLALLRKVIYERTFQEAHIERLLVSAIQILESHAEELESEPERTNAVAEAIGFVRGHLFECHAAFKDWAFREEEEWRLILAQPITAGELAQPAGGQDQIRFRAGQSLLIPYREIALAKRAGVGAGKLPLERVVIGPTTPSTIAQTALELFLRSRGHVGVGVRRSSVPLRWM